MTPRAEAILAEVRGHLEALGAMLESPELRSLVFDVKLGRAAEPLKVLLTPLLERPARSGSYVREKVLDRG